MLAVTLLLDRDLGPWGTWAGFPRADVLSQTVTVRRRRTARYPPLRTVVSLQTGFRSRTHIRLI